MIKGYLNREARAIYGAAALPRRAEGPKPNIAENIVSQSGGNEFYRET
jgi:hypothetical protein